MKNFDQLSESLEIENDMEILPAVIEPKPVPAVVPVEAEDAISDYTLSRDTFRSLITKGNDALDGITELASESESPRAYEVLATLMKTVSDTTKDLFELQSKVRTLNASGQHNKGKVDTGTVTVDKAVFVGSTAELLQQMKDRKDA
jgi:hypothetical protein